MSSMPSNWPRFVELEWDDVERRREAEEQEYEEQLFRDQVDYIFDQSKPIIKAVVDFLGLEARKAIKLNIQIDPTKMSPQEASNYVKELQGLLNEDIFE